MTIKNQIPSLTPTTQALDTLNTAFAGLLTQETTAHGHQTGGQTTTVLLLLLGWGLLVLHGLGRRILAARGRVVSLGRRWLLVRLLVGHIVSREGTTVVSRRETEATEVKLT